MKQERKSIISHEWDLINGVVTFKTLNVGECKLNVGELVGDVWPEMSDVGKIMCLHGGTQKVRDEAALSRDTTNGQSATPEAKHEAMSVLCDRLNAGGEWNLKGGGGKPALNRAALFAAIAQVRNVEAEKVAMKFQDRPDDVLRAFLTHREIAAAYAALTVRDTKQAQDLLAELE